MIEMISLFGAILNVPTAIDSARNLLKGLRDRSDLPGGVPPELDSAIAQLSRAKDCLCEFAVAFDELEAWKLLHDITSKMRHQLGDSFAHRTAMHANPTEYAKTFYDVGKPMLERQCKNLYLQEGAIGLLQEKLDTGKLDPLHPSFQDFVVPGPKPHALKRAWHVELQEAVSLLAEKNSDPQEVFKQIFYLDRFVGSLNAKANGSILRAITEYARIIQDLRNSLNLDTIDA